MLQDLRHALRLLRRNPGFAVAAVLTLGLGLGSAIAVSAVAYGVLVRPLPIHDGERVVAVFQTNPRMNSWREPVSGLRFEEWRARAGVFAGMTAASNRPLDVMLDGAAERVDGELVAGNFFEVLGVPPLRGRLFTVQDESDGSSIPCVVSERLWRGRFGSAPSVLGEPISIAGVTLTIVGVVPEAFAKWRSPAEVWIPYDLTPTLLPPEVLAEDGYRLLSVLGRLRPGVTLEHANATLAALDAQVSGALGDRGPGGVAVLPPRDAVTGPALRRSLEILAAASAVILLLASANVASLLLARGVGRKREFATRRALGASPGRLGRQLLAESGVIALGGVGFGLLVASWTIPVLVALAPPEVARRAMVGLDRPLLALAACAALAAAVCVSVLPALRVRRCDVVMDLRTGSASTSAPGAHRAQAFLVFAQMAVSVPLLAAAGLLGASLARLLATDPGFEARQLLTMSLALSETAYSTPESALAFHRRVLERVSSIPGVEAAGIGSAPVKYLVPGVVRSTSITIEGRGRFLNAESRTAPLTPGRRHVTPGYLEALGLRLVAGRLLTEADAAARTPVAVINQTMARMHWPGQDPIGKRVNFEGVRPGRPLLEPWTEIVGVVADARQDRFHAPPRPEVFTPLAQRRSVAREATLLVRSSLPPAGLTAALRAAIQGIDANVPVFDVRTMTGIIREATATPRYGAGLVGLFAVIALALTAAGIHGLGAFAAAQRTREIGVRVALGATRSDVLGLVVGEGLKPAACGLVVGIGAAIGGTRLLRGLLHEVEPSDPGVLAAALLVLVSVAVVAAYGPARRAARIDPMEALRTE